jgi:hypothetical protein
VFARGASDTPQWAPGVVSNPVRNSDSGSIPLSVNKLRNVSHAGAFSSQRPGHEAAYALDDSNGNWWEPAEDDKQPTLTVDLNQGPTQWDPEQFFTADSSRIEFLARGGLGGARGAAAPAPPAPNPLAASHAKAFRYKIELSTDGKEYSKVVDKTNNETTRYTEFDEIPPTKCRYVRLTITDWPHTGNSPFGIVEFTVFGTPVKAPKR